MAKLLIKDERSEPIAYLFGTHSLVTFSDIIQERKDSQLSSIAKTSVIKLYRDIERIFNLYDLKYARASFNLLVMLREASPWRKRRERRDDTSAYIHEIAQATYYAWMFENQKTIQSWLKKRQDNPNMLHPKLRYQKAANDNRPIHCLITTPEELDIFMAIAFNHDSMEDLGLTAGRFGRFLNTVNYAAQDIIDTIVQGVDDLTKRDKDKPHAWMNRAKNTSISLLAKSVDRMHNLATIIGSDRPEPKIRKYIAETLEFLDRAAPKIRKNGTVTYVAQHLYDQCDLLELYFDVKNKKKPFSILEQRAEELVEQYDVTSVHHSIHPMLCTVGRALTDILQIPAQAHAVGRSAQPRGGQAPAKRVS